MQVELAPQTGCGTVLLSTYSEPANDSILAYQLGYCEVHNLSSTWTVQAVKGPWYNWMETAGGQLIRFLRLSRVCSDAGNLINCPPVETTTLDVIW